MDFADYGVVRKVMNITKHYIKVSLSGSTFYFREWQIFNFRGKELKLICQDLG